MLENIWGTDSGGEETSRLKFNPRSTSELNKKTYTAEQQAVFKSFLEDQEN